MQYKHYIGTVLPQKVKGYLLYYWGLDNLDVGLQASQVPG